MDIYPTTFCMFMPKTKQLQYLLHMLFANMAETNMSTELGIYAKYM